jgi:hypothetical protein
LDDSIAFGSQQLAIQNSVDMLGDIDELRLIRQIWFDFEFFMRVGKIRPSALIVAYLSLFIVFVLFL